MAACDRVRAGSAPGLHHHQHQANDVDRAHHPAKREVDAERTGVDHRQVAVVLLGDGAAAKRADPDSKRGCVDRLGSLRVEVGAVTGAGIVLQILDAGGSLRNHIAHLRQHDGKHRERQHHAHRRSQQHLENAAAAKQGGDQVGNQHRSGG